MPATTRRQARSNALASPEPPATPCDGPDAPAPAPRRETVGFSSLPQELRDMVWAEALQDTTPARQAVPGIMNDYFQVRDVCVTPDIDNQHVLCEVEEDDKTSIRVKVEQCNVLSVDIHPVTQLCSDARAFAARTSSRRNMLRIHPAPLFSHVTYRKDTPEDSEPPQNPLSWPASSLSNLPYIVLNPAYIHSHQKDFADWNTISDRMKIIEALSDNIDKQLMILRPQTWVLTIRGAPNGTVNTSSTTEQELRPEEVVPRWQELHRQCLILDTEDLTAFQELKIVVSQAKEWGAYAIPRAGPFIGRYEFMNLLTRWTSRSAARSALKQSELRSHSNLVKMINRQQGRDGLRPLSLYDVKVGVPIKFVFQ
ncbi:hypothetical protein QBC34DRAFT_392755 [Podospora aff. communis PSN243]|uniref:Uncharacterized protein n=1 Tax=Podospora aff. communis PSN243 TaxID=3040156 RepID=A0AAV9H2K3_9PEZI|nr:hypothetical protein QBC34DRAFT_392755 [Podospora aff. communis PSN243]